MKISDFDYDLPEEKIAIYPPAIRGNSKLLALNKITGEFTDRVYSDLVDYFNPGDVLVLNDTKVIKARLNGQKSSGGNVEIIVLEKHIGVQYTKPMDQELQNLNKVLYKGTLKQGDKVTISNYEFEVENIIGSGIAEISGNVDLYDIADDSGQVPIPPYLHRESDKNDEERYQTIFAKIKGSVAAPTASLNFTKDLEQRLILKGVKICYLTLHVGLGTFLPVRTDEVEDHDIHSEYFEMPQETIEIIRNAKSEKKSIVALGTTVTRTLEFMSNYIISEKQTQPFLTGEANIFIYPGYEFKIVDKLITNFHAPRSTVLLLASAFAGKEKLQSAYTHALKSGYKFLSYGDSMVVY
jgi:S-adenosylmethionine:tRNA ribosyltransferase-isomerase